MIHDDAQKAKPEAVALLAESLLRIFLADASGNNGLINGESMLCRAHASEARAALEAAGVPIPKWVKK